MNIVWKNEETYYCENNNFNIIKCKQNVYVVNEIQISVIKKSSIYNNVQ